MNEFLFIFRNGPRPAEMPSPEELQAITKKWMDWIGGIAAQNKLVARGSSLKGEGKVLKPGNVVTDGPYAEIKETIAGFSIIRAESLEEAAEIAKGCPGLQMGGSVEVRPTNQM